MAISIINPIVKDHTSGGCVWFNIGEYKIAFYTWSGQIACTVSEPSYNGYRSGDIHFDIPSGIFTETPKYAMISNSRYGAITPRQIVPLGVRTFGCFFWSGTSVTSTAGFTALLIGK